MRFERQSALTFPERAFLAKAIAHDLSATEKLSGPGTDRMGRPVDPSCEGALGPYWPAGRP
jgi:hypothetical protein